MENNGSPDKVCGKAPAHGYRIADLGVAIFQIRVR